MCVCVCERERERERQMRGRGGDEKVAKGTETSLLRSFQQKPVNNAHYGIRGVGGGGQDAYISGIFLKHNWPYLSSDYV